MLIPEVFKIDAIATSSPAYTFKKVTHETKPLDEHQVYIKVKACGICHTDLMMMDQPDQILGHEAVGEVVAFGSKVTHLSRGDLVGYAYLKSSCLNCLDCNSGNDIMCADRVMFPEGKNNGYANGAVCDARFVYKIPKGIEAEYAGPLMCAGSTVFSAMYNANLSPTARIAIVGIGGLGHLALQFAKAWGCYVVAISSTEDKREDALRFGAHEYWNAKEFTPEFVKNAEKFDMILNTVSVQLEWDIYLSLLKPNGNFRLVGIPEGDIRINNILPFLLHQKNFTGAILGGRRINKLMLEFAARHNIRPQIETFPMTVEGVTEAVKRVHEGKARYRAVLMMQD